MILQRLISLMLVGTCACLPLFVSGATLTERLDTFLSGTLEGTGAFEQRVITKGGEEAAPVASGHFRFHRPGRFSWAYESPYKQLIVSNGETLWFYDEDLAQVTRSSLSGSLPTSPASILFGTGHLDEAEWQVNEIGERDGLLWLSATPRAAGVFERVEIGFAKEGVAPVRMRLIDGFGQVTTLSFSDFRSERVPVASFDWIVPDGVDVLDMNTP